MGFNLLVRPSLELFHHESDWQTSTLEDGKGEELSPKHQVQELRDQEGDKNQEGEHNNVSSAAEAPNLKLKIPSYNMEGDKEDEPEEGFKTPTSSDGKIPAILQCPPTPKKPKPIPSRKRKSNCAPPILLDLSKQIDSLFPSPLDLGGKIKKVKHGNDTDPSVI